MVRVLTKSDLQVIEQKGGSVERIPKPGPETIQVSGLESIVEHFHQMKHEQHMAHEEHFKAKMVKIEELITAIRAGKTDLAPLMKMMADIQEEHAKMKAEYSEGEEHEPCEYLLTFERDQRGLIDGTKGIRFKPVEE